MPRQRWTIPSHVDERMRDARDSKEVPGGTGEKERESLRERESGGESERE